ncbi:hypothetical protein VTK26DRAFT_577 [Humicola hyalothermophila]
MTHASVQLFMPKVVSLSIPGGPTRRWPPGAPSQQDPMERYKKWNKTNQPVATSGGLVWSPTSEGLPKRSGKGHRDVAATTDSSSWRLTLRWGWTTTMPDLEQGDSAATPTGLGPIASTTSHLPRRVGGSGKRQELFRWHIPGQRIVFPEPLASSEAPACQESVEPTSTPEDACMRVCNLLLIHCEPENERSRTARGVTST